MRVKHEGNGGLDREAARTEVRRALTALYDGPRLQKSRLARLLPPPAGSERPGEPLRKRLVQAMERLAPDPSAPENLRIQRRFQLFKSRYVDQLSPEEVCERLAIRHSEYYRLVEEGLEAILIALEPLWQPAPTVAPLTNLAPDLTSFIGRVRDIEGVVRMLSRKTTRLVTLTGPGGVGKTRLALQAAQTLEQAFTDGVHVVSLAALNDPGLVPVSTATSLGIDVPHDLPIESAISAQLRPKRLLLVLDNFEQVLPAAPFVARLMAECPGIHVLVTSRSRLRLQGERVFEVQPLELAGTHTPITAEDAGAADAVALFVERAKVARPGFAFDDTNASAVAAICERLDGLPLAIELAAARLRLLPPGLLLERLEPRLPLLTAGPSDAPDRQRTLRSTLDWSYDLLSAAEQGLFSQLGAFVGGAPLTAIEAVAMASGANQVAVLDGLTSLVDSSLLRQREDGEPRFTMLETVREYAYERLAARPDCTAVLRQHGAHYLGLARVAKQELNGEHQLRWLSELEQEHDNMRAVLRRAAEGLLPQDLGLELAATLTQFWRVRGHLTEGRRWLTALLRADSAEATVRGRALYSAGTLAYHQGDFSEALPEFLGAERLFEGIGDAVGAADAKELQANVHRRLGAYQKAEVLHEASLAVYRDAGDLQRVGVVLNNLALTLQDAGAYERARPLLEEALTTQRSLQNEVMVGIVLHNLGVQAMYRGDYTASEALQRESLAIGTKFGDKLGIAARTTALGKLLTRLNRFDEAVEQYRSALNLLLSLQDALRTVECFEGLAALILRIGTPELAGRLCGAAAALKTSRGLVTSAGQVADLQAVEVTLQRALPPDAYAEALRAGAGLTVAGALDLTMRYVPTKSPADVP